MVPSEFLQIAEGLNHLDPVRTYPARAAKLIADLANATSYRVELEHDQRSSMDSTPPPPPDGKAVSLPLRHGRQTLGTIHLFLPDNGKLDGQDLRMARWGARALARGLSYTNRMNRPTGDLRRNAQEIQSRLERTPLTRREKEVVALLVSGATTRGIAEQTRLTVATVHTYLKRIYSKLGVHSRVELVARMVGTVGSVPPPEGEASEHLDDQDHDGALDIEPIPGNPVPSFN